MRPWSVINFLEVPYDAATGSITPDVANQCVKHLDLLDTRAGVDLIKRKL